MNLKQLFCKHEYIYNAEKKVAVKSKYFDSTNLFDVCTKCGHRVLGGTYTETRSSDGAVKIIMDIAKELGMWESYKNQEWGSFYYGEFRTTVAEILDYEGKETAKKYARSILDKHL